MNILPFSIEKGEYSDRYYHTEFLKLCASANCTFIEKPTNEFYFVAGEVHRFTYNNIITNINEQIKTDLQNNKAKIILSSLFTYVSTSHLGNVSKNNNAFPKGVRSRPSSLSL